MSTLQGNPGSRVGSTPARRRLRWLDRLILMAVLAACAGTAMGAREPTTAPGRALEALSPTLVTPEILAARIAEVEAAADIPQEAKTRLLELYRSGTSSLEEARAHTARALAFGEAARIAPAQAEMVRAELAAVAGADPLDTLEVRLESSRQEIERRLEDEQAGLAVAVTRQAEIERHLTFERDRASAIGARLAEVKQQQEEVAASLSDTLGIDEGSALAQARRWALEARYEALAAEIRMLEQELLSRPMRTDLLEAQRDREAADVERIGLRIATLDELVNRKRRREAQRARDEAAAARRQAADLHPVLLRLFDQNAEIVDELGAMAAQLDTLDQDRAQAERLAARIGADLENAEAILGSIGKAEGLGRQLLAQRESLPDIRLFRRRALDRERRIAAAVATRLRHQVEARRLADPDLVFTELAATSSAEATPEVRASFLELVESRRLLLDQVLEAEAFYLAGLRELDTAERGLLETAGAYRALLDKHLMWLRNADRSRLVDLADLPGDVRRLFSPEVWGGLARAFFDQIRGALVYWLTLLVAVVVIWRHRSLIAAIQATSEPSGEPISDRFGHTARALALTLIAAAPWPLLLAGVGWQLELAAQGAVLPHALGLSLIRVALYLYVLLALRTMCIPRGLAVSHLGWPESSASLFRRELGWLVRILVPSTLVMRLAVELNPVETGGTIARLAYLVCCLVLARFLYRVLHPRRGVLAPLPPRGEGGPLYRTYKVWFPLLVVTPLLMATSALAGYLYSAAKLYYLFLNSSCLIAALIVTYALALRRLLVAQRRLVQDPEQATGEAAPPGSDGETEVPQFEEPEADVVALSEESRELLRTTIVFLGLAGLYLLWSPVLPALRVLDDVTLWHHTATVDGEVRNLPITLANLGLALLYAFGTVFLAKRLPAVLEMSLLRRADTTSGSRYTVTRLATYTVVAVGTLLVINTLGGQWSQFQWMVAALSVGIGFGLQEIVANFISGLIMLFERPVRIGDIVTIGETSGVVTRIQARATTVRNWDRQELLVPNKEFITGRLLNWSLSDEVIRCLIEVGVAYGTDVDRALALMREAAEEEELVLDEPAPILAFEGFGESSLDLTLRVYLPSFDHYFATMTTLRAAIQRKFEKAGITIAFPQRDLHLDTREPLRVSLSSDEPPD